MYAGLKWDGTVPDISDRLNSSTQNGARMSIVSFKSRVSIGSLAHCFSGKIRTAATISSTVIGLKSTRPHPIRTAVNVGGLASAVDA
jgi:hypothetical protein